MRIDFVCQGETGIAHDYEMDFVIMPRIRVELLLRLAPFAGFNPNPFR